LEPPRLVFCLVRTLIITICSMYVYVLDIKQKSGIVNDFSSVMAQDNEKVVSMIVMHTREKREEGRK